MPADPIVFPDALSAALAAWPERPAAATSLLLERPSTLVGILAVSAGVPVREHRRLAAWPGRWVPAAVLATTPDRGLLIAPASGPLWRREALAANPHLPAATFSQILAGDLPRRVLRALVMNPSLPASAARRLAAMDLAPLWRSGHPFARRALGRLAGRHRVLRPVLAAAPLPVAAGLARVGGLEESCAAQLVARASRHLPLAVALAANPALPDAALTAALRELREAAAAPFADAAHARDRFRARRFGTATAQLADVLLPLGDGRQTQAVFSLLPRLPWNLWLLAMTHPGLPEPVLDGVASRLGDDPAAWRVMLSLAADMDGAQARLDPGGWAQRWLELSEVAAALAGS